MHRKISRTLSPPAQLGIDHIDIPDSTILGKTLRRSYSVQNVERPMANYTRTRKNRRRDQKS
jgi:hypothetical protein